MFKNDYQGGAVVEIFCAQGKDPVAKWKLSGGTIHKEYNKEIKGFVYCLEGSSQTVKMQMPRNGKMSLGLLQRFLVFQVNVPHDRDFSIELMVTDTAHLKRRLYLSTVHKELSTTLWHAKIPLWSTLCIDLVSFTRKLFKDAAFVSLDGITVFANCSIRRLFTMKAEPIGAGKFICGLMEWIPRSCHFPKDIKHITQVLNIENMKKSDNTSQKNKNNTTIQCNTTYWNATVKMMNGPEWF
uniref:Zgc:162324 n=1 Tax=Neogobius melanostomus TaxID=47308 RepID=A0A8C6UZG2_9GOBI